MSTPASSLVFTVEPHVRSSVNRDTALLLDLRRGRYLSLTGVGAQIWALLAGSRSTGDILRALATRYAVPQDQLAADLKRFLDQLHAKGLVRIHPQAAPGAESTTSARMTLRNAGQRAMALATLCICGLTIAATGFRGLHALVSRWPVLAPIRRDPVAARQVCATVDAASRLYFKPVLCLQRSATAVGMLRLRGFPAQLVIAGRTPPFYAHAWAELDGEILNEPQDVRALFTVLECC